MDTTNLASFDAEQLLGNKEPGTTEQLPVRVFANTLNNAHTTKIQQRNLDLGTKEKRGLWKPRTRLFVKPSFLFRYPPGPPTLDPRTDESVG